MKAPINNNIYVTTSFANNGNIVCNGNGTVIRPDGKPWNFAPITPSGQITYTGKSFHFLKLNDVGTAVQLSVNPTPGASITWSPGNGTGPIFYANGPGTYTATVLNNGCIATDSVVITVSSGSGSTTTGALTTGVINGAGTTGRTTTGSVTTDSITTNDFNTATTGSTIVTTSPRAPLTTTGSNTEGFVTTALGSHVSSGGGRRNGLPIPAIIGGIIGVIIIVAIIAITVIFLRRRKRNSNREPPELELQDDGNILKWMINELETPSMDSLLLTGIEIKKQIGKGNFGIVYKGIWQGERILK